MKLESEAESFATNGELCMSTGFIQQLMEQPMACRAAIMQVLNFSSKKENTSAPYSARARLSDGCFSYTSVFQLHFFQVHERIAACFFDVQLANHPGLEVLEREASAKRVPIIAVTRAAFEDKNNVQGRTPLVIYAFEVIVTEEEIIYGNPQKHDGQVEAHRGQPDFGTVQIYKFPAALAGQNDSFDEGGENDTVESSLQPPPAKRRAPDLEPLAGGRAPTGTAAAFGSPSATRRAPPNQVIPIAKITPYIVRWRIAGVVSAKDPIRQITQARRGEMRILNWEVTDQGGSTIRCTAFGEQADLFNSRLHVDSAYYFANMNIRASNKRFNTTGHDYELTARSDTECTPATDLDIRPQHVQLTNITPIANIPQVAGEQAAARLSAPTTPGGGGSNFENSAPTAPVNVLAVVHSVGELKEFTSRQGKAMRKRDLVLVDDSKASIVYTMWAEQAAEEPYAPSTSLAIKGASARCWNDQWTLSGGRIVVNPNESADLLGWYVSNKSEDFASISAGGGGSSTFGGQSGAETVCLGALSALNVASLMEGETYYANVYASVVNFNTERAVYQSCQECRCKVTASDDSGYKCERCDRAFAQPPVWRFTLNVELADPTGQIANISTFGETAQKLLGGMTANEFVRLRDNPQMGEKTLEQRLYEHRNHVKWCRIAVKVESYQDEKRLRFTLNRVDEPDWTVYRDELARTVQAFEQNAEKFPDLTHDAMAGAI